MGGSPLGLGSARSLPGTMWEQTFRASCWKVSFTDRVKKSLPIHVSLSFASLFPSSVLVFDITALMGWGIFWKSLRWSFGAHAPIVPEFCPACTANESSAALILALCGNAQAQQWRVQLTGAVWSLGQPYLAVLEVTCELPALHRVAVRLKGCMRYPRALVTWESEGSVEIERSCLPASVLVSHAAEPFSIKSQDLERPNRCRPPWFIQSDAIYHLTFLSKSPSCQPWLRFVIPRAAEQKGQTVWNIPTSKGHFIDSGCCLRKGTTCSQWCGPGWAGCVILHNPAAISRQQRGSRSCLLCCVHSHCFLQGFLSSRRSL